MPFFRKSNPHSKPKEIKRSAQVSINPQEDLVWLICRNQVESVGKGVSVEIFISECKILKFDLFSAGNGHFHLFTGNSDIKSGRIKIPEQTLKQQTERLAFELEFNLRNYRKLHSDERIRAFKIDVPAIRSALPKLKKAVLERGTH
ncbi:hypothetical protein [Phaeodactylibacter xiamenensis]|uniref:hypothetical protein n=1 Tax=Phaeodactylibacter xiamenensis TaxID=1524460 RepID=UPI0024A93361|nr:hypothetical protein [Phaeodactylibacter xiamenensis]